VSEIKFDGYRLLARVDHGEVRLLTRNGHDWADRLPAVAQAVAALGVRTALLDGELVALRESGASSFPDLQAALSDGNDGQLTFFLFDLLHLNGWDLRPCALRDRKQALAALADWRGMLRYSDHVEGHTAELRRRACGMGLEGIICKRADAPYRPGRGKDWLKVKCQGREELIVLGWTLPGGSRTGLGSLQLGYHDQAGRLHYAGGVGTGFTERELTELRGRLDALAAAPPAELLVAGEPLEPGIHWVRPELVAEIQFTAWSGAGRVRHPVYLGLREDKSAGQVVLTPPDPEAKRSVVKPRAAPGRVSIARRGPKIAVPPVHRPEPAQEGTGAANPRPSVVIAHAPKRGRETIGGVELSHADRPLWPGITKRDLAAYWLAVAEQALPWLAHRPLAIVRCPEGIGGEHFFQKRGNGLLPEQIREGSAEGSPFLVIDDAAGLVAMAQMSAIELHPWGAAEADPLHPDWIVLDLDPGEGVASAR
jgi:bifunctional non-homologous end joining protein LigD